MKQGRANTPLVSAFFSVGHRWLSKLLGVISTIILARLLVPDDFGIIAMASVAVGLADVLVSLGTNVALINKKDATTDDFNSAWTIRILQSAASALIIICAAPFTSDYFNDTRVAPVMCVMALTIFITGFENIGIVSYVKNMQFGREFQFRMTQRLITFGITICFALYLKNYWAMTLGSLVSHVIGVIISYYYHPYRPSLTLVKGAEIWRISKWILIQNIGHFSYKKLDEILLGGRVESASLGTYSLAKEISSMPTSEILAPIGRVLYPMFVNARDKPADLQRAYFLSMGLQAMFVVPAAVGLAMIAESLVGTLLGEKWLSAAPILGILAFGGMLTGLSHSTSYLLMTLGRFHFIGLLPWANLTLLILLVFYFFHPSSATEFAYINLTLSVIQCVAVLFYALLSSTGLTVGGFIHNTWRPILASLFMALALSWHNNVAPIYPARLLAEVFIGMSTYVFCTMLFWFISGKPDGAERYVLNKATLALQSRR